MVQTRNSLQLEDFTGYCKRNPQLRFWQALRNWSGYGFILASEVLPMESQTDTFHWEGRDR